MEGMSKFIKLLPVLILPLCFAVSSVQGQTQPRPIPEDIKSDLMKLRHAGYLIDYCKDSATSDEELDKFLNLHMKKRATEERLIEIYNNENPDKYTFEYSPDLHPNFNKTIAAFVNDRGGCTDKLVTEITREIQIIRGSRPVPRWVLLIWGAVLGVIFFKFAKFSFNLFKGKLK